MIFDHTGFITSSIERSVQFWTEVMGFRAEPIVERSGDWVAGFTGIPSAAIRIAHLFGHGAHIEFVEFVSPKGNEGDLAANRATVAHVCLKVTDIQTIHDRILASGGRPQGTISTITEGPASGIRGLYIRDPEGILIELLEARS